MQIKDPARIDKLLRESAFGENILPLTSSRGTGISFCSNNPPEINSIDIGHVSIEQILNIVDFLDPGIPIIIGESAGILVEGEPTLHPDFFKIFKLLTDKFPHTPVEITTDGCNIDQRAMERLSHNQNLKLKIAVNSASIRGRNLLMNESKEKSSTIIENLKLLSKYGISFSGSLIALTEITGWDDIRLTLRFLCENNAETLEVLLPSYSSYTDERILPRDKDIIWNLKEIINSIRDEIDCPILIKPSLLYNLIPEVNDVLRNSPAWEAGIRRGDIISSVNGRAPICRVDAWNMLSVSGKITASVKSGQTIKTIEWSNPRQYCSGITMEYDFNPSRAEYIKQVIEHNIGKVILLTSESGYELICRIMELYKINKESAEILKVKNITYGGNIKAAGLLTVDDYLAEIRKNEKKIE